MKTPVRCLSVLWLVAALGLSSPAGAVLLGDTITITFEDPLGAPTETLTTTVATGTTDAVTSFIFPPFFPQQFLINPEDLSIQFDYIGFGTGFGGGFYRIAGINTPLSFVSLTAFGNATGLDNSDISLVGNDIVIDFAGYNLPGDNSSKGFIINLRDVPEPGTLALLGLGLLGLGMARRKAA